MRLRLLDLDGSVVGQQPFREAVQAGAAQVIDLRRQGPALRLWGKARQMADLTRLPADLPAPPTNPPADPADGSRDADPIVTFTGSGDYHHLTGAMLAAYLARHDQPISLLHFDNHPDWVRLPPAWHCGSWVNRALDLPQLARIVTLGPCANDLDRPQWKGGNLAALASGRLEMWPWRHPPSRVWGSAASGPGRTRDGDFLVWRNLADEPDFAALDDILDRLPTQAVWLTIDKDVLRPEDAVTNWDQGGMPLSWLCEAIRRIRARRTLVGADICGEFSPPRFGANWLKSLSARLDQPAQPHHSPDLARNAAANQAILAALKATV